MAGKKVKLQYITNDAMRRSTLRKRRAGILKKVQELSVLCGVNACGIIYSPGEAAPQVWPKPEAAKAILKAFYSLPEFERNCKISNHVTFMTERVAAQKYKLARCEGGNFNKEVRVILYDGFLGSDFSGVSRDDLRCLERASNTLDKMITKVISRISLMRGVDMRPVAAPPVMAPTAPAIGQAGPSTWAMQVQGDESDGSDDYWISSEDTTTEVSDSEDEDDDDDDRDDDDDKEKE